MDGQDTERGIVPRREGKLPGSHGPLYVGLAVSAVLSAWYPLVGLMVLGFALRSLLETDGRRALAASALIAVGVSVAVGVAASPMNGVSLALALATGIAVTALMWARRATPSAVIIVIALAALATAAVDILVVSAYGYDTGQVAVAYFTEAMRETVGQGVQADLAMRASDAIIRVLWPIVYPVGAAWNAAFAAVGSNFAGFKHGRRPARFENFDAPAWCVAVLALAAVGLGASLGGLPGADAVLPASATAAMCLRFVFALQGYGVVLALMTKHRVGCLLQAVVIFLVVWAEVMFFVLSIAGLVDVWANFRGLPRGATRTETDNR